MIKTRFLFITTLLILMINVVIQAQDEPEATEEPLPIAPQLVEVEALDGLILVGDFYLVDPSRPTIILLHELYVSRTMWRSLLRPLLGQGYNILAVDLRGYGETRGSINWTRAIEDIAVWMAWLRNVAGVRGDAISTMGSSMGANLALVGCGNDEFCRTAIAVSPGWSYFGVSVAEAIVTRPMLVVYAERDRYPALGVPRMIELAPEILSVYTYEGNSHGKYLIAAEIETFVPLMLEWLAGHAG